MLAIVLVRTGLIEYELLCLIVGFVVIRSRQTDDCDMYVGRLHVIIAYESRCDWQYRTLHADRLGLVQHYLSALCVVLYYTIFTILLNVGAFCCAELRANGSIKSALKLK